MKASIAVGRERELCNLFVAQISETASSPSGLLRFESQHSRPAHEENYHPADQNYHGRQCRHQQPAKTSDRLDH